MYCFFVRCCSLSFQYLPTTITSPTTLLNCYDASGMLSLKDKQRGTYHFPIYVSIQDSNRLMCSLYNTLGLLLGTIKTQQDSVVLALLDTIICMNRDDTCSINFFIPGILQRFNVSHLLAIISGSLLFEEELYSLIQIEYKEPPYPSKASYFLKDSTLTVDIWFKDKSTNINKAEYQFKDKQQSVLKFSKFKENLSSNIHWKLSKNTMISIVYKKITLCN